MSGAIFRTDLSWPAIVAFELGDFETFRRPVYEPPGGPGGIPLDIERALRSFEAASDRRRDWYEIVGVARWLHGYLDKIEDYWERGDGTKTPPGRRDPAQPGDLRMGPARHAFAHRDEGAPPDRARAGRRLAPEAEGRGRQRPGGALRARDCARARQPRADAARRRARAGRPGHQRVRRGAGDRDPRRAPRARTTRFRR